MTFVYTHTEHNKSSSNLIVIKNNYSLMKYLTLHNYIITMTCTGKCISNYMTIKLKEIWNDEYLERRLLFLF